MGKLGEHLAELKKQVETIKSTPGDNVFALELDDDVNDAWPMLLQEVENVFGVSAARVAEPRTNLCSLPGSRSGGTAYEVQSAIGLWKGYVLALVGTGGHGSSLCFGTSNGLVCLLAERSQQVVGMVDRSAATASRVESAG